MVFFNSFIVLFADAAPWLMMGLFLAGLMRTLIPVQLLNQHLGSQGIVPVIKAALFGAPLPLCSCGVIPVALSLRRSGASKSATVSFLIATPETGVDSVSASYALLGPFLAVIRPIAAIMSAITAGLLTSLQSSSEMNKIAEVEERPCCSQDKSPVIKQQDSCCASTTQTIEPTWIEKIKSGLTFTFIDLMQDIVLWLMVGLVFAALVQAYVPESFFLQWGHSTWAFIIMALVGVPMYICATASTPIAAGFLLAGVSPGAVLVFLLVGPATNIATMALVAKEMGKKTLAAYLLGVVGIAFIFGFITNYLSQQWQIDFSQQMAQSHSMLPTALSQSLSVIFAIILLNALYRNFFNKK